MFIFKHDKDICAICLEEKKFPIILICDHSFCEHCLAVYITYSEIRSKCPLCRKTLAEKGKPAKWFYLKCLGLFMFSVTSIILFLHVYTG